MRRVLVSLAIVAAAGLAPSAAAPARPDACTDGDAKALLQVLPQAALLRGSGVEAPQIVDSLERCQYRVFFHGATFTFSEHDVILGGVVWRWDYAEQDMSRAEAIAEIEAIEDRVWIDGVEQQLERTTFKDMVHPLFGRVVFQHRAFTIKLPPGTYTSLWESVDPVFGTSSATVTLVITPGP